MTRNTSLTPAVKKKIIAALEGGAYLDTAAAYAGISRTTFYNWLRRGEREIQLRESGKGKHAEEDDFVELKYEVNEILAKVELNLLDQVICHGSKTWMAPAWVLERRWPEKYSRVQLTQLSVDGGEEVGESALIKALKDPAAIKGVFADEVQNHDAKDEKCCQKKEEEEEDRD